MAMRVVIVDDSARFLDSARALLEREGMDVVAVASTPSMAVEEVRRQRPDVVLLDLHFGTVSGLDLARRLTPDRTTAPAVVLVSTASPEDVEPMLAGSPVRGFVSKVDLSALAVAAVVGAAS
jgi:two-component system nitrate/nitrite response regulator NarL